MSKHKKISKRKAAKVSVAPMPDHWDMGAKGPANRIGLVQEPVTWTNDKGEQVNPNNVGKFSLSIEKATDIQALAQDYRILHSMARELGHVAIKVDQAEEENVMANIADTVREFSGYLTSVTDAVADSRVTDNELREIDVHLCEMVQQAHHLRATVAHMNKQLKDRVVDLHSKGKAISTKIRKGRG